MQKQSYLNPLKKLAPPLANFETFDVEAVGDTWKDFAFLGHYDGREFRNFDSVPEYVDWLMTTGGQTRRVYAHFLDYDFMFISEELRKRKDITTRVTLANSLLLSASLIKGDKEVQFLNSYSLLQYSLDELMWRFLRKHKTSLDELGKRNYEDCVCLHQILKMFTETVGTCGMTMSQMTMQYYRNKFQKAPMHNNWQLDRFVRESYFGGRVEIFNFNLDPDAKAYLYDINSMYPYVMREFPYPVAKMQKAYEHEEGALGVCRVEIEGEGLVPLACERVAGKTMFLNAKKRVWTTTFEFEKLKEMGAKVEYKYGFETPKVEYIFRDYIDELYAKRMQAKVEGNDVYDTTYKLLMNSLYGKFGQRTEKTTYMINADTEEGLADVTPVSDDRVFSFFSENRRNAFVIPIIAALTTAYARERLHQYLGKLDFESVLYCDSLPYDRRVFVKFPNGDINLIKIGELYDKYAGARGLLTLSFDGNRAKFMPIKKMIRHAYHGKLLKFNTKYGSTVVTPQHSVYVFDGGIRLADAGTLKAGGMLVSLTNVKTSPNYRSGHVFDAAGMDMGRYGEELKFSPSQVSTKKFKCRRIPRRWTLDKNLAWLLGFYCAEGSVTDIMTKSGRKCVLSFGGQDRGLIKRVKAILDVKSGAATKIIRYFDPRNKKYMYYYRIGGLPIVALFECGFGAGKNCEFVKVPWFIFSAEEPLRKAFIEGYLEGDGVKFHDKRYKTHFTRFSTKSRELAEGLSFLLKGLTHGVNSRGGEIRHVFWQYRKDKPKIMDLRLQSAKAPSAEGFCSAEIRSVTELPNEPYVYDLEVEGSHNFADAEGMILVHNTDSIYTTEKKLENSKQLGMMKLEAEAQPFYVINPKFYVAGKMKIRAKGVPRPDKKKAEGAENPADKCSEKQDISMNTFYSYLCGGQVKARRGLVKFRSAIRGYARGDNLVRVKEVKRSMRSVYDKRHMQFIGEDTKPFHVRTRPDLYTMMNRKQFAEFLRKVKPLIAELRVEQK